MRSPLLALALAALPMHAAADAYTTVVATVNGADITVADLRATLGSLPEQFRQAPIEQILPGLVDQIIQQEAVAATAQRVDVEAEVAAYRRSLLARAALEAHVEEVVTDAEIEAAYEARVADFAPATEYNAAHILVETEEEAREIIAELDGGADFAELARERSTGPSGPRGGDLGYFPAGAMVPAFDQAVQSMEPGTVLPEPVETQFGHHVIRLIETRETEPPTLEALRPQIEGDLQRAAVQDFITRIEGEAEITRTPIEEIDPALVAGE